MATMLNLEALLRSAVDLIRDRFVFYHVQVYIVDEHATSASLAASTGEIGDKLLLRRYRVPINNSTIIGRVIQKGEPEFLTSADIATAPVEGAPRQSRGFEYALPIKEGEEIIGVLDVQALRPDAFGDVEQQALQVMSGQLATAIRNAKLFQSQEQNILENKKLFLETKTNLSEIQRLNRQLTRQSWDEYLSSRRIIDGVTLDGDAFRPRADWTERMREASQRRRAMHEQTYSGITIAAPIELRGEVVGALEIEVPHDVNLEDMLDMLRPISQRLAISLDNARLFEETQEATAHEPRISEIVSQYQSAGTVDDLLQITLEGLAETLGAEKASIRIGSPALAGFQNGTAHSEETAQ
jgi:GAF domain-containing protein